MSGRFGNFPMGALFAVHDDGNVTAFSWRAVTNALDLEAGSGGRARR